MSTADQEARLGRARAALAEAEALASASAGASGGAGGVGGFDSAASGDGPAGDGEAASAGLRRARRAAAAGPSDPEERETESKARQIVLRQLAMAPRSRAQLEEKLAAEEIGPDVAAAVLDRFEEVGLVDDEAYAEMLVRSQQESRGLSRRGLRNELRKKGVDPDIAEDALAGVDDASERIRAEELVATRIRRMHSLPKDVQMRRLAGFLARKGYPGDLAYAVIRDAVHNAQEHSRD